MIHHSSFLILILLSASPYSRAQTPVFKIDGATLPRHSMPAVYGSAVVLNDSTYAVEGELWGAFNRRDDELGSKRFIQLLDRRTLQERSILPVLVDAEDIDGTCLLRTGDHAFLLSYRCDRNAEHYTWSSTPILPDGMGTGALRTIDEGPITKDACRSKKDGIVELGRFIPMRSPNGTFACAYRPYTPMNTMEGFPLAWLRTQEVVIMDEPDHVLWAGRIDCDPGKHQEDQRILDAALGDDGTAYFITYDRAKKPLERTIILHTIDARQQTSAPVTLDAGKAVLSCRLEAAPDGRVSVAGVYGLRAMRDPIISGTFIMRHGPDGWSVPHASELVNPLTVVTPASGGSALRAQLSRETGTLADASKRIHEVIGTHTLSDGGRVLVLEERGADMVGYLPVSTAPSPCCHWIRRTTWSGWRCMNGSTPALPSSVVRAGPCVSRTGYSSSPRRIPSDSGDEWMTKGAS